MTIPERTGAVRISGQPVPAAREVMAAYDQAVGHPGPWLSGSLAIWMPRLRAAADPPAGLPEPFAREMAGDWRGAAAAWDQLARPYDAAVVRLGSPDEAALREALKTLDDLGPARRVLRTGCSKLVTWAGTTWSYHPVPTAAAAVWIQLGIGIWLQVAAHVTWSRLAGLGQPRLGAGRLGVR